MNRLPLVRAFLQTEAQQFPALVIDYVPGRSPELQFLDRHQRVIDTVDIADMDSNGIRQAMLRHGISQDTPSPTYTPPEFAATASCVAWRQTANCDPDANREAMADESCDKVIENGRSGFCECKSKPRIGFACTHRDFTCEELCSASDDAGTGGAAADAVTPGMPLGEEVAPPEMDEF